VRRTALHLLSLFLLGFAGCYGGSRPPRIGTPAPDFTVQDADRKVTLSELRGKVVVLNFWATWCPPCIEETPSLLEMHRQMKNKGITVLGVSLDASDSAYHRFLQERGIDLDRARRPPAEQRFIRDFQVP